MTDETIDPVAPEATPVEEPKIETETPAQ